MSTTILDMSAVQDIAEGLAAAASALGQITSQALTIEDEDGDSLEYLFGPDIGALAESLADITDRLLAIPDLPESAELSLISVRRELAR